METKPKFEIGDVFEFENSVTYVLGIVVNLTKLYTEKNHLYKFIPLKRTGRHYFLDGYKFEGTSYIGLHSKLKENSNLIKVLYG